MILLNKIYTQYNYVYKQKVFKLLVSCTFVTESNTFYFDAYLLKIHLFVPNRFIIIVYILVMNKKQLFITFLILMLKFCLLQLSYKSRKNIQYIFVMNIHRSQKTGLYSVNLFRIFIQYIRGLDFQCYFIIITVHLRLLCLILCMCSSI